VSEPPAARGAPRRSRPRPDLRLVLGIVLVLASVAGVVAVVRAADTTVAVYAAAAALAPGQRISGADLTRRDVVLDGGEQRYLAVSAVPPGGLVVRRAVGRGELVPRAAVGSAATAGLTALVVSVRGELASAVQPGAAVDLWAATSTDGDRGGDGAGGPAAGGAPPVVLVSAATLVAVHDRGTLVADDGHAVELRLPLSRVARVLQAEVDGATLTIVPSGLPLGGSP
jgi:hypothetical protein